MLLGSHSSLIIIPLVKEKHGEVHMCAGSDEQGQADCEESAGSYAF